MQDIKKPFIIKTDYKNFTGFLTIKKLNQRQVKWAEMLVEYHFKIKHVKGSDNAKTDTFNRKKELQNNNKMSRALLKQKKKIWYNHPQLAGTYKAPISLWT